MNVCANSSHLKVHLKGLMLATRTLLSGVQLVWSIAVKSYHDHHRAGPISQDSFHEQITFRVQFWTSTCSQCFAWKPETQTSETSLNCENWGRTCSVILGTKISIFLVSSLWLCLDFPIHWCCRPVSCLSYPWQQSCLCQPPHTGGLLLSGKVKFLLLFPKYQSATIPPMW